MLLAMLVGCGGGTTQCLSPLDACPGAIGANVVYLCDGGPCGAGAHQASENWQCVCGQGSAAAVLVLERPVDCGAAQVRWSDFEAANCR
jgi:hypothetical protein